MVAFGISTADMKMETAQEQIAALSELADNSLRILRYTTTTMGGITALETARHAISELQRVNSGDLLNHAEQRKILDCIRDQRRGIRHNGY